MRYTFETMLRRFAKYGYGNAFSMGGFAAIYNYIKSSEIDYRDKFKLTKKIIWGIADTKSKDRFFEFDSVEQFNASLDYMSHIAGFKVNPVKEIDDITAYIVKPKLHNGIFNAKQFWEEDKHEFENGFVVIML